MSPVFRKFEPRSPNFKVDARYTEADNTHECLFRGRGWGRHSRRAGWVYLSDTGMMRYDMICYMVWYDMTQHNIQHYTITCITEVPPKEKRSECLSLWGPLGDTPPIRNNMFLGPCEAPEVTNTKVTSAKAPFRAYPSGDQMRTRRMHRFLPFAPVSVENRSPYPVLK